MSDKNDYIGSTPLPLPLAFSMSRTQISYVTNMVEVLGVAKFDDNSKALILDFKTVIAQHQYATESLLKEDFRIVEIPYANILSVDLKETWPFGKPKNLIIQVDSQGVIKDVPVVSPGRIDLEIKGANKKAARYFTASLQERISRNKDTFFNN